MLVRSVAKYDALELMAIINLTLFLNQWLTSQTSLGSTPASAIYCEQNINKIIRSENPKVSRGEGSRLKSKSFTLKLIKILIRNWTSRIFDSF